MAIIIIGDAKIGRRIIGAFDQLLNTEVEREEALESARLAVRNHYGDDTVFDAIYLHLTIDDLMTDYIHHEILYSEDYNSRYQETREGRGPSKRLDCLPYTFYIQVELMYEARLNLVKYRHTPTLSVEQDLLAATLIDSATLLAHGLFDDLAAIIDTYADNPSAEIQGLLEGEKVPEVRLAEIEEFGKKLKGFTESVAASLVATEEKAAELLVAQQSHPDTEADLPESADVPEVSECDTLDSEAADETFTDLSVELCAHFKSLGWGADDAIAMESDGLTTFDTPELPQLSGDEVWTEGFAMADTNNPEFGVADIAEHTGLAAEHQNGDLDFVDPSTPFVFVLEAASKCTMAYTSMAVDDMSNQVQTLDGEMLESGELAEALDISDKTVLRGVMTPTSVVLRKDGVTFLNQALPVVGDCFITKGDIAWIVVENPNEAGICTIKELDINETNAVIMNMNHDMITKDYMCKVDLAKTISLGDLINIVDDSLYPFFNVDTHKLEWYCHKSDFNRVVQAILDILCYGSEKVKVANDGTFENLVLNGITDAGYSIPAEDISRTCEVPEDALDPDEYKTWGETDMIVPLGDLNPTTAVEELSILTTILDRMPVVGDCVKDSYDGIWSIEAIDKASSKCTMGRTSVNKPVFVEPADAVEYQAQVSFNGYVHNVGDYLIFNKDDSLHKVVAIDHESKLTTLRIMSEFDESEGSTRCLAHADDASAFHRVALRDSEYIMEVGEEERTFNSNAPFLKAYDIDTTVNEVYLQTMGLFSTPDDTAGDS